MREVSTITINGKAVRYIREGTGKIDCLFIGPGSIYLPDFPAGIKNFFTFHDVDYYWSYSQNIARIDTDEISNLTLAKLVEYYETVRLSLGLKEVVVIGPSAVGLVASEYAERYPETTTHVIMLGTPATMQGLTELSSEFCQDNYQPLCFPDIQTAENTAKFNKLQLTVKEFTQTNDKLSAEEAYIQELMANQVKYWHNMPEESVLRERWKFFNLHTRSHFFANLIPNYKLRSIINVPTLAVCGLYDGVAPCFEIPELIATKEIRGKIDYYIFPDAAHFAHSEAENFTEIIKEWVLKNSAQEPTIEQPSIVKSSMI